MSLPSEEEGSYYCLPTPVRSRRAPRTSADSIFSCSRLLLASFVQFILGSRTQTNKAHIGWRPKWFAIQIGAPPNWRRQAETARCALRRVVRRSLGRYPLIAFKLRD